MSFSSITAEQREREEDALRSFLAFSLIGSLALHTAVLALGNFWSRTSEKFAEEPIEVLVVDPPNLQVPEPKEETQSASGSKAGASGVLTGSGSAGGSVASGGSETRGGGSNEGSSTPITRSTQSSQPITNARALTKPAPVIAEKQPTPITTAPIQKLVENLKTPAQQQKPAQTQPPEVAAEPKPIIKSSPIPAASPEPASTSQLPVAVNQPPQKVTPSVPNSPSLQNQEQGTEKLRNLLTGVRNPRENQGIAANSTASSDKPSGAGTRQGNVVVGSGNGIGSRFGTGTGNGLGSGSGTGTGSGNGLGSGSGTGAQSGNTEASATGSRRSTPGNGNGNGDSTGSGSGRLACRNCSKPKYPEKARRRGQEGRAEISVDVDDKGKVTNVRLARSSGHSELDEAAIREARRWKFDAPRGGRQGITAKVDFAIEGSERSRQVRERRRQREAVRRNRQSGTENATRKPAADTTAERSTPNRRIRTTSRPSVAQPSAARSSNSTSSVSPRRTQEAAPRRRRVESSSSGRSQQATPRTQNRLRQSLRRQRVETATPRRSQQAAPRTQTKLRQSLRLYQQRSQSAPKPANSAPNGGE
jgi:TonB family protein